MMRRAATTVLARANLSRRALPQIGAPASASGSSGFGSTSHHLYGPQRLLSSSSKTPPSQPPVGSTKAVVDKGQEAIEKSERLHVELKELIAVQRARQIEELEKPIGSGFLEFLKASKPEMLNIFFAFVCVLLAYQIHGMRAGIRKLLADKEEQNAEIDSLRGLLAKLTKGEAEAGGEVDANDNTFSMRLAQKCAGVVRNMFEESEQRAGYSWILGKKLASGDSLELEKLAEDLQPIILTDIQSAVGDAAFTPEEMKERRVEALKVENESPTVSMPTGGNQMSDAQMGGLMEILEEVHTQDLTDKQNATGSEDGDNASTKVRRTRYAI